MKNTQLAFVVGSGRCGTALLGQRFLPVFDQAIEAHHEYKCEQIQEAAVRWYSNRINRIEVYNLLQRLYGAARDYSEAPLWVDCSNKVSWLIGPLTECFPNLKFVHLVRDGYKTCSSFYHKLADEAYTERGVNTLARWVANPEKYPIPPQEKEWWWPQPSGDVLTRFVNTWNKFERICWHWAEVNKTIEISLQNYVLPANRLFIRLEDLAGDGGETARVLCEFLGLKWQRDYLPLLTRRHNVIEPVDYGLTAEQLRSFNLIAGEVQRKYYG